MIMDEALVILSERYGFDLDNLHTAAAGDTVGGYHPDPQFAKWPVGSVFDVEGRLLYAIAQAIEPKVIVNLGTLHGCSLMHLAQTGAKVYAIDQSIGQCDTTLFKGLDVEFVEADGVEWLKNYSSRRKFDLVFEDFGHSIEGTADVWTAAMPNVKKGGFIISHDSEHPRVGEHVRIGIAMAGVGDVTRLLVEPSDCGLAIWRNE